MSKRRVVVTGIGAITPLGLNAPEFWKNLIAGKSGAATITYFDTSLFGTHFACEVKGFKATDFLDRKAAQRMDPFSQFAVVASDEAVKDSGLPLQDVDAHMLG